MDGGAPEHQASKEAAQALQPVMAPDQKNSKKTGNVDSQKEERVSRYANTMKSDMGTQLRPNVSAVFIPMSVRGRV